MEANIEEIWKDVIGFERYQVSNLGNVKSKSKGILSGTVWGWYRRVKFYKDRSRHYFSVHRLVAMHFIENPDNKPCVLHNDNNPLNNIESNLRWGTFLENNLQALKEGRKLNIGRSQPKGEDSPTAKLTNEKVTKIRKAISKGLSLRQIAKKYGTTPANIWKIKAGYSWVLY